LFGCWSLRHNFIIIREVIILVARGMIIDLLSLWSSVPSPIFILIIVLHHVVVAMLIVTHGLRLGKELKRNLVAFRA
jgi:uncharacterized membrane protein